MPPPTHGVQSGRPAPRALASWKRRDPRAHHEEIQMTTVQLSDTQRQILMSACERRGRWVLPLIVDLKGGGNPPQDHLWRRTPHDHSPLALSTIWLHSTIRLVEAMKPMRGLRKRAMTQLRR